MSDKQKSADINEISSDERLWAILAYLAIVAVAIIGPLVIWIVKKEESAFVEDQAKEALNFQITVLIVSIGQVIL